MKALGGRQVVLRDGELLRRERDNRAYMLRLTRENISSRRASGPATTWTIASTAAGSRPPAPSGVTLPATT